MADKAALGIMACKFTANKTEDLGWQVILLIVLEKKATQRSGTKGRQ